MTQQQELHSATTELIGLVEKQCVLKMKDTDFAGPVADWILPIICAAARAWVEQQSDFWARKDAPVSQQSEGEQPTLKELQESHLRAQSALAHRVLGDPRISVSVAPPLPELASELNLVEGLNDTKLQEPLSPSPDLAGARGHSQPELERAARQAAALGGTMADYLPNLAGARNEGEEHPAQAALNKCWKALGIEQYSPTPLHEIITALRSQLDASQASEKDWRDREKFLSDTLSDTQKRLAYSNYILEGHERENTNLYAHLSSTQARLDAFERHEYPAQLDEKQTALEAAERARDTWADRCEKYRQNGDEAANERIRTMDKIARIASLEQENARLTALIGAIS